MPARASASHGIDTLMYPKALRASAQKARRSLWKLVPFKLPGQNVYLRTDVKKSRSREMYRVVTVDMKTKTAKIQKTEGAVRKRLYVVKRAQLIPVPLAALEKLHSEEKEAVDDSVTEKENSDNSARAATLQ